MTKEGKRFLLLYGSQTGQAKAIAEEIAENATQHGFFPDIHCLSLTEKKFWLEREKLAVIVTSTTGDGEPPDTAGKFCRRLKKKTLPADYLANLTYTILGLGDSNYSNFCNCAKNVNKRLEELGAKKFYEPGWADDAVGLEIVVEPWMEGLYKALDEHFKNGNTESTDMPNVIPQCAPDRDCGASNIVNNLSQNDSAQVNTLVSEESNDVKSNCVEDSNTSESRTQGISDMKISQSNNLAEKEICDKNAPVENGLPKDTEPGSNGDSLNNVGSCDGNLTDEQKLRSRGEKSGDVANGDSQTAEVLAPSLKHSVPPLSESGLTLPLLQPQFLHISYADDGELDTTNLPIQNGAAMPSSKSSVSMVPVISTSRITSDDAVKTTYQFILDTRSCDWDYTAGDSVGVVCPNNTQEVQRLIQRLDSSCVSDKLCTLSVIPGTKKKRAAVPEYIPERATLRHILTTCCDIRTPPKKAFLRSLVEYTSDPGEKRRLQELCSKQGAQDFTKYIREPNVSILDVLMTFTSCQPPVSVILEHLPRLQARPYSASSSPKLEPGKLSFVFNLIQIPEGEGRVFGRSGVCTGWLEGMVGKRRGEDILEEGMEAMRIEDDIQMPIFLRSNQYFRPPTDLTTPIILVGPGTGVAPFIGFLQHRQCQIGSDTDTVAGESWLFFGCRNKDKDYLFRDEMASFVTKGVLSRLLVSFSRDTQEPGTPKYVQDNIRLNGEKLANLIMDKGAMVFVCGDANNMAKNVGESFAEILKIHKGLSQKDAEGKILQLRLQKQYLEDVWT